MPRTAVAGCGNLLHLLRKVPLRRCDPGLEGCRLYDLHHPGLDLYQAMYPLNIPQEKRNALPMELDQKQNILKINKKCQ